MQRNRTQRPFTLTVAEVKGKLAKRGFRIIAHYARMIHVHRSTVTRLIRGEIAGNLRERLARFLGVPESALPRKNSEAEKIKFNDRKKRIPRA